MEICDNQIPNQIVLIKVVGDQATGGAARLYPSVYAVVMTERPDPLMIQRSVLFSACNR